MPSIWEYDAEYASLEICVLMLIITLFIITNWRIGVGAILFVFLVYYICISIKQRKYNKINKVFEDYLKRGLTPCLLYAKGTDPLGRMYTLILDDTLSETFAVLNAEWLAFNPIIVFLSKKQKTDFGKKYFRTPIETKNFYKEKIAHLPSCKLNYENLSAIENCLKDKQLEFLGNYVDDEIKSIKTKLSNIKDKK